MVDVEKASVSCKVGLGLAGRLSVGRLAMKCSRIDFVDETKGRSVDIPDGAIVFVMESRRDGQHVLTDYDLIAG